MKLKYFSVILIIFIVMLGCESNNSNKEDLMDNDIDLNVDTTGRSAHVKRVKKIFYNVPSPIEMTSLMQRAGAEFDPSVLNSYDKVSRYTSVNDMALNLGVYGSDLSYTRIFDQIQTTVNYLSSIKDLSEGLGIPQDKGSFAVSRIEENINNRDSLLQIIAETYSAADEYLKENDRGSTAALIIAGGWIEGLYIAVNIVGEEGNYNQEILTRIAEQKYSVDNLIELMSVYENEDEHIQDCLPKLVNLKSIFDGVEITYTKGEIITNPETKTTTITSKASVDITTEDLIKIRENVTKIRKEIVK